MREYRFVDKSTWGEGPWQYEPDKIQYLDEATGLDCLIVRNPHGGFFCGYVGVPPDHPCFGVSYDDCQADVHGGLTFANFCIHDERGEHGICHVPDPGRSDRVWWLGFDAAHAWDLSPGDAALLPPDLKPGMCKVYRDLEYMKRECQDLAAQLLALKVEAKAK